MLLSTIIIMLPKKNIRMSESQFSFGILFLCSPSFNHLLINEHNHNQPTLPTHTQNQINRIHLILVILIADILAHPVSAGYYTYIN